MVRTRRHGLPEVTGVPGPRWRRRAGRAATATFAAGLAAAMTGALGPPARAETAAGYAAADAARRFVADRTAFSDPGADLQMFIEAWSGLGVDEAGWDAALVDPSMSAGHAGGGRGDAPARLLAAAACGGASLATWAVDHADQPQRGDLVLYRPAPAPGGPVAYHVGIVVGQTAVVVVQSLDGAPRAVPVPRERLFHAEQADAADRPVADPTAEISFCHVDPALVPAGLRAPPDAAGAVRLVDPQEVADTLAWNSEHPRDRDGGGAILRMLEILALIPGAGSGAAVGLLVFGLAAVHDGGEGLVAVLTAPFAWLRAGLTATVDGAGLKRGLTAGLLALLVARLLDGPFALSLGTGLSVAVAAALQGGVGGGFRPLSWLLAAAWGAAGYAVGILTGLDDSGSTPAASVVLALLADAALVLGGSRLLRFGGPIAVLARTSALGRGAGAAMSWSGASAALDRLARSRLARLALDADRGAVAAGQTVLGRLGNLVGLKPSAWVPTGGEMTSAVARTLGEAVPLETAPQTVAEAVAGARLGALGTTPAWLSVRAELYTMGLHAADAVSWFTWRPGAVAGDVLSMLGEVGEWMAGRLGRAHLTHPFVRRLDALLGHLDPAVREQLLEVTLPGLRDASRLVSLHSGGRLAGDVLTGATPLPRPGLPPASVGGEEIEATWGLWVASTSLGAAT